METLQLLGSALGLSFLAGVRLYATVLALGLALHFHLLHLGPRYQDLNVLSHPAVLSAAAVCYLAEFFADKVPWVDSLWDVFHTVIRPLGAALLAAATLGSLDPTLKVALAILCGGVALASHSSKAATRVLVNHSPEPFSNIAVSLIEDLIVPSGVWLSFVHPAVALGVVALFSALFLVLAPAIFRAVRLQSLAVWVWITRSATQAVRVPADYARAVRPDIDSLSGFRAAATKSLKGLRNSIGYLIPQGDDLVFVTRRNFRFRTYRVTRATPQTAFWRKGFFLDRLTVRTTAGDVSYLLFKGTERPF